MFAVGQVFEGTLQFSGINGTDSVPVIAGKYGDSAQAIINGGSKESVIIEKSRFIRIQNLVLKGDGRKNGNTANPEILKAWADSTAKEKYIGFPQISQIFTYHDLSLITQP